MSGQVLAEFPSPQSLRRRTIRGPVNPLDKCTIVSIYPKEVIEKKPTIFPAEFIIPPGTYEFPQTLVVGPSSWWKEIDEEQPLLEIPISSILIAESIIVDYCNPMIGVQPNVHGPGLFYIPGQIGIARIIKEYRNELDAANARQRLWYAYLVKMADALWARTNGNPRAIPDEAKLAASELKLERDWIKDFHATEMTKCAACGSLRDAKFPVCPNCKAVIDPERAKALNLQFAN